MVINFERAVTPHESWVSLAMVIIWNLFSVKGLPDQCRERLGSRLFIILSLVHVFIRIILNTLQDLGVLYWAGPSIVYFGLLEHLMEALRVSAMVDKSSQLLLVYIFDPQFTTIVEVMLGKVLWDRFQPGILFLEIDLWYSWDSRDLWLLVESVEIIWVVKWFGFTLDLIEFAWGWLLLWLGSLALGIIHVRRFIHELILFSQSNKRALCKVINALGALTFYFVFSVIKIWFWW